jgi:hypothetical protein
MIRIIIHAPEGLWYYHPRQAVRICLHSLYLPALTPDSVPGQTFHCSVVPSLPEGSIGMLTDCPSAAPPSQRAHLRPRLTLIRLTLIRKPQSYGVPVSHRHYRYLCLHLLFHALHHASQHSFVAHGMLPYPTPRAWPALR